MNHVLRESISQTSRLLRIMRSLVPATEQIADQPTGLATGAPRTFYVDSGNVDAAATNTGLDPQQPFATLVTAIGAASPNRGDVILINPGHSESLAAQVAINVAGLSIIGLGDGQARPQFTLTANTVDMFSVTAVDVLIENLYFNEGTGGTAGVNIDVGAARCTLRNLHMDLGVNDVQPITVPAGGDNLVIEDCVFLQTANGPDAVIELEAAGVDQVDIRRNLFVADTNGYDDAAIFDAATAVTNVRVYDNKFIRGTALNLATSVSAAVWENEYHVNCRPSVDSPLTFWAADGRTTVGDGTPEDPTTITDAVDRCTAAGDKVYLLPGTYSIAVADVLNMDVAGMVLQMAPGYGIGSVLISVDQSGADINGVIVTAAGCTIRGIRFIHSEAPGAATAAVINVDANQFTFEDCEIDLGGLAATGLDIADAFADCSILRCKFIDPGAAGFCIVSAIDAMLIEDCVFDLSGGTGASIDQTATSLGWVIRNNAFISAGSDIVHIVWDGTPGAGHAVYGNRVLSSTGALDVLGIAATELSFADNLHGTTTGIDALIDPSV